MPGTQDKNLSVKITSKVELSALQLLRKEFNENAKALSAMSIAGKQSTAEFQKLSAVQKQLGQQIKEVTRESKGLSAQTKMSSAQWLEFGENLTIVGAGLLFVAQRIIGATTQIIKSAAEVEVYRKRFVELAGSEEKAEKQLLLLQKASAGNLDDKALFQYSNQMQLLGINSEETALLLDLVERKADEVGVTFETGESALQRFILTGAGKGLKDLGINIADVTKSMEAYAKEQGLVLKNLDDESLQMLRLKVILKDYGSTVDDVNGKIKDSGDRFASLGVIWNNLTDSLGTGLLVSFNQLYDIAEKVNIPAKTMNDIFSIMGKSVLPALFSPLFGIVNLFGQLSGIVAKLPDQLVGTLSVLSPILSIAKGISMLTGGNQKTEGFDEFTKQFEDVRPDRRDFIPSFEYKNKAPTGGNSGNAKETTNDIQDLLKKIAELKKEQAITPQGSNMFASYSQQIDVLQVQVDYLNKSLKETQAINGTPVSITGKQSGFPLLPNITNQPTDLSNVDYIGNEKKKALEKQNNDVDTLLSEYNNLFSEVGNIFDLLGVETDSFVSKLISGFTDTLSIVNSVVSILNNINSLGGGSGLLSGIFGSLLSIIPGGGAVGAIAGAVGGGRSSVDFNRFNGGQAGMRQPVNVYLSSNIPVERFMKQGIEDYQRNKFKTRL